MPTHKLEETSESKADDDEDDEDGKDASHIDGKVGLQDEHPEAFLSADEFGDDHTEDTKDQRNVEAGENIGRGPGKLDEPKGLCPTRFERPHQL